MAYASQISLPSWNISQSLPKKLGGSKSVKHVSLLCVHSKQIKYLEIVDQSFNYNHTVVLWNLTSLFLPKIIVCTLLDEIRKLEPIKMELYL